MKTFLLILFFALGIQLSFSQINVQNTPISFEEELSRNVPTIQLASPNILAIEKEDKMMLSKANPIDTVLY